MGLLLIIMRNYWTMLAVALLLGLALVVEPEWNAVAQEAVAAPLADTVSARDRIARLVGKLRSNSNIAEYTLTVARPSWTRSLTLKSWDDRINKRVFIRILDPAKERGKAFLRIDYNLWSYLPNVEKEVKIPPSMMLQSWMGSDFTNDDLVKESSYINDYTHRTVEEKVEGDKTVLKIELLPKPHAPVVWGKVIFWIWKEKDLPLWQAFYDEGGKLVKTMQFRDFKVMDGMLIPTVWEMVVKDGSGHKSTLTMNSMDRDPVPAIASWIFTKQHFARAQ